VTMRSSVNGRTTAGAGEVELLANGWRCRIAAAPPIGARGRVEAVMSTSAFIAAALHKAGSSGAPTREPRSHLGWGPESLYVT
jgi:hypothetical protein